MQELSGKPILIKKGNESKGDIQKECLQQTANTLQKTYVQTFRASFAKGTLVAMLRERTEP
jgi:hypothetical protein